MCGQARSETIYERFVCTIQITITVSQIWRASNTQNIKQIQCKQIQFKSPISLCVMTKQTFLFSGFVMVRRTAATMRMKNIATRFVCIPSQLCTNLTRCNWVCPLTYNSTAYNVSCNDSLQALETLTFDLSVPNKLSLSGQEQSKELCIYIPNICGMISGTSNGQHLVSCEEYKCQSNYFKCPGFYCLPWRFVCNGQWDCPGGTDETHCNRTACPGMFKCKASSICTSYESLCDVISDCPLNDDEYFCDKGLTLQSCPGNCSCLQFSLFCKEFMLGVQYNIKFYTFCEHCKS